MNKLIKFLSKVKINKNQILLKEILIRLLMKVNKAKFLTYMTFYYQDLH